jgi:hypothetical protein
LRKTLSAPGHYLEPQSAVHAALCSFACRIVSSVSRDDQRIGSNAEQATASVPMGAVVVAQPGRISSAIGSNAARITRFANEIERMGAHAVGRQFAPVGPGAAVADLIAASVLDRNGRIAIAAGEARIHTRLMPVVCLLSEARVRST